MLLCYCMELIVLLLLKTSALHWAHPPPLLHLARFQTTNNPYKNQYYNLQNQGYNHYNQSAASPFCMACWTFWRERTGRWLIFYCNHRIHTCNIDAPSVAAFKSRLKTHLYTLAFSPYYLTSVQLSLFICRCLGFRYFLNLVKNIYLYLNL